MVEWWGVVATAVALVLQHHHVSVTADIKSYTLKRFWLSSSTAALTRCPPKKIEVPVKIQLPRLFCTVACTSDPNCKFFSLVGRTCHIQTLSLSPGYDVPGSDLQSYIILDGSPRDYATNMPVQAGSIFPGYPDPATLTDGTFCWTDPLQCSCTEPTNQWFTIDLQETRTIARIIVTTSFLYDVSYFHDTSIHVGATGSYQTDPIVATKDAILPIQDFQVFTYDVSASGRYVTLRKTGTIALCLCNVQVFSY